MFLLVYCALTILVGVIASSRGRSGLGWALLSLVVSPLLAVIVLLILPNRTIGPAHGLGVNEAIRQHAIELEYGHHIRSHKPAFSGRTVHDVTIDGTKRRFTSKIDALAYVAAVRGMQAQLPQSHPVDTIPPPRRD